MKLHLAAVLAALFALSGLVFSAQAETLPPLDPQATPLVLGTATQGGGFQLFGQILTDVINAKDAALKVESIATRGSRQNLALLERAEIDIGLVEGNAARQALDGVGRSAADLKVLAVMYPNPGMFVVRASSAYRTIDDLKGRPIAFGTRASGLRILVNDVLSGLGLSPERDFQQIILEKAADGPEMVLSGEADALWGAGIGWPGFVKISESQDGGRFIAPSAEEVQRILSRHPHLRPMSVPAGSYRGQDARIDSVGLWSLVLVRTDMPDTVAYRLAAAIHAGEPAMAQRLAQGRFTTAENTVREVPHSRLHPGAMRYYRAAGILR
ncbi:MAG: TAXI family TRAP transporter solute-binding subunit [Sedimenticolaceae bacterium]